MIHRWWRYLRAAYRPSVQVPYAVAWALGLTALFAATGPLPRWRPGGDLLLTAVTLVVTMLLIRPLDDIRDLAYDRRVNPDRPLPRGLATEVDLVILVALGSILLLLLNAGRPAALAVLAVQQVYTAAVVALERLRGWPARHQVGWQLGVNLPILALLSLYVYAGYLRAAQLSPGLAGLVAVAAVTTAAICPEIGRKVTRTAPAGERSYVSVLGPRGASLTALAAAVAATQAMLLLLAPWQPGNGWGWLVVTPLALPAYAVGRFGAGAARWPVLPTVAYVPAMYTSCLAAGLLTRGPLA